MLNSEIPIVSISLGETRIFRFRDKTKKIVLDIPLEDELCVIMGGKIQEEFTHEIPKINCNKGLKIGKRINITLRSFKE
jgi:alkylated DNA repair dioxygenase AlkB